MSSSQPPVLPKVDPPGPPWEDCRSIFAAELAAHRQSLQHCLEEWVQEQDGIFERAIARVSGSSSLQRQTEASQELLRASPTWDGSVADKSGKLAACIPLDHQLVISSQGADPLDFGSFSTSKLDESLGTLTGSKTKESIGDVHRQATALGFRRDSTRRSYKQNRIFKTTIMVKLSDIVHSRRFESLCAVVILANAVLLGMASDYAMAHVENPENPVMSAIELGFCCFYSVEVCLRIAVFGCGYFRSVDWRWNLFDLTLVIMSIWDQIEARLNLSASAFENLSFLRLLRLMKMLKLLRMIRLMRMFRELRLILYSVLGCVQAMFWASILIATTSYMFGICFLQACTQYLQSLDQADFNSDVVSDINEYWSSIGTVMLSLYMAATAGREWSAVARPLKSVGWLFYFLFLLYIAFFAFVVMNTVTSLFIEATMSNADKDQQAIIQLELEKKDAYIYKLQEFYDEIDEDQDGCISFEEFCHHVDRPQMRAFATSLEIDVLDAKQFFSILSDQGRRNVDIETFVVGCIKLKGAARSMDLMDLVYAHKEAHGENRLAAAKQLQGLEVLEKLLKSNFAGTRRSGSQTSI